MPPQVKHQIMTKTKAECGRLGGLRTLEKYGKDHFVALAKKWWTIYRLEPYSTGQFKIVRRRVIYGKPITGLIAQTSFVQLPKGNLPISVDSMKLRQ